MHILLEGQAELRLEKQTILLTPGDLVVLPRGMRHQLRAPNAGRRLALAQAAELVAGAGLGPVRWQGPGAGRTELACGVFHFSAEDHPLLAALPSVLHFRPADTSVIPRLSRYLESLLSELRNPGPGSELIVARLAEVLLSVRPEVGCEACPTRGSRGSWPHSPPTSRAPGRSPAWPRSPANPAPTSRNTFRRSWVSRPGPSSPAGACSTRVASCAPATRPWTRSRSRLGTARPRPSRRPSFGSTAAPRASFAAADQVGAPRWAARRSRSAKTPPAVTSGPAPGPCTIKGWVA